MVPKVSVVIPVFNVEQYLKRCLDSVLGQTYKDIEIILVDDGSTDTSGKICDDFQVNDARIQVLHKENGGQHSARKVGVSAAKGEFVLFIDSDDWIEKQMVEYLVHTAEAENADIVTSGHLKEYGKTQTVVIDSLPEGTYTSDEERRFLYSHMICNGSVDKVGIRGTLWSKLFRMDLIRETIDNQSDDIRYAEDAALVFRCFVRAERIVITHQIYYHYVMRNNSVMHSTDRYYLRSFNEWYLCMKEDIKNSDYYDLLEKQIEVYLLKGILMGINYYMGLQKENSIPYYQFNEEVFEQGTKVVLYGAGRVGQSYYKQIEGSRKIKFVRWIDVDYIRYQEMGMDVVGINQLSALKYDCILLAIHDEIMASKIREQLLQLGIENNKIVWMKPSNILDQYIKL